MGGSWGNRAGLLLATSLALVIAVGSLTAAAATPNPERDTRLGPENGAGYFLGFPSPTYSWHGCTKSDTHSWHVSLVDGTPVPASKRGTSRYLRFTVNRTGYPRFSWKTKPGYRICGVQAAVQMSSPQVDSDLLGEAGYTSGVTSGSTSTTGRESVKVTIPKRGIRKQGFEQYEGRTFSIVAFQSVSVFVKKR